MSSKTTTFSKDFGDDEEPSVLSTDPNERKLARRLRIQKRAEALQKLDEEENESVEEESQCEKQIIASATLLEKLIVEGNEVITNVRVANDARELERRKEASRIRNELLKRLEESATECQERYDVINDRWASILLSNDPLDINSEMESQKRKCDEVLAKKDEVIAELQAELSNADKKYFEDQKKQKDDIKLLTERIENQMHSMEIVYGRELQFIETTLKSERDALIENFKEKWDALYKQQEDEDAAGDEKRYEILRDYENEIDRVMREHDEEYREQKIKMESQCQELQEQVERTKAMCILNEEKLSYNYTVLKNREEENSIVKSQQKRKINKLQSIINNLKKHYADLEENTKLEIEKLTSQITKAYKNIRELEEKSNHFTRVNEKQYLDIWNMNAENANELLQQILEKDKNIHESTLGILWEPPKQSVLKKEDLPSYRTAIDIIEKKKQEEAERLKIFETERLEKTLSEVKFEEKILHNILKQISNCSGYLIEDKLQELILHYSEEEKSIIRLDSIFQALAISTPEEINMLIQFFLPHAYCPICSAKDSTTPSSSKPSVSTESSDCKEICEGCQDENIKKLVAAIEKEIKAETIINSDSEETRSSMSELISEASVTEEACEQSTIQQCDCVDNEDTLKSRSKRFKCDKGHVLEIQAAHVTKAMKEIVTKYSLAEQKKMLSFEKRLREKKFTISRNLTAEDVRNYWMSYSQVFDDSKEKFWDTVLMGLNKYYEILKERHKLCTETESLKQHNAELERLLRSHTSDADDGLCLLQVKTAKNSYSALK